VNSSEPPATTAPLDAELSPAFPGIPDLDCRGRRVFLRIDPLVLDASNAEGSSLRQLLHEEARVLIGTTLDAEAAEETGVQSLDALAARLGEQLGVDVFLPDECVGDAVVRVLGQLRPGQICLLPDLLAQPGERDNDERFARALANLADAYVGDAFSSSHLVHASLVRLPRLMPRRALGVQARRELSALTGLAGAARGSLALCLGGQRFADKIEFLDAWLPRVRTLCVGGNVAMTLLVAAGKAPASASTEPEHLARARSMLARARDLGVELVLPIDLRAQLPNQGETWVVSPRALPAGAELVDLGPESIELFSQALGAHEHLLWWGPLGDTQLDAGRESSRRLAALCARPVVRAVVLGAATRRFVRQLPAEVTAEIDLVSTSTAAARACLSNKRLPGIEALRQRA